MEERSQYHNDVMFSALSGLLFFWFVVQYSLKKDSHSWNENERLFVKSWCSIGNYMLILLLLFFLNVILFEIFSMGVFSVLAQAIWFLVLFIIFLSLPLLISWKNIRFCDIETSDDEKKQIIISYIPFLSSYEWYSLKLFDSPNLWLKEAQLWFFVFWLLMFFFNSWMVSLVFWGFIILRVILLLCWKDFFSGEQKQRMRHWFLIYPEESFSVIYTFIRQGISLLFKKKEVSVEELLKYQESYRLQWNIKTYLLTMLFCCLIGVFIFYWWMIWLYWKIVPIVWILLRIFIFLITKTRIPKFPIVAEMTI